MKKFVAVMNDCSFINIYATRMEIVENAIVVYDGEDTIAYIDTSAVISAHLSERNESHEQKRLA